MKRTLTTFAFVLVSLVFCRVGEAKTWFDTAWDGAGDALRSTGMMPVWTKWCNKHCVCRLSDGRDVKDANCSYITDPFPSSQNTPAPPQAPPQTPPQTGKQIDN